MAIAEINVPTSSIPFLLTLEAGRSTVFVGANGAGKTRLGVMIEQHLAAHQVRRISAHRSLTMSDTLSAISLDRALQALATGYPDQGAHRESHRYNNKPAVALLNDYDYLLQALFAQQTREAVQHLQNHSINKDQKPPVTILSKLKEIWERLLPHRKLHLLDMSVQVAPTESTAGTPYPASEMSDGERVIFYLLGHCLLAPKDCLILIDEPELHIHKAILGKLWDAIEAARKDCAFVYITHDLDFLVARPTAAKIVIRSYSPNRNWEIEALPSGTDLPDRVISELVGSRQPVLFVEGNRDSIDAVIYRCVYSNFLIQPIGGCSAVVHAVATFRHNATLHRIGTVRGCVDADAREATEVQYLYSQQIYVLPVAEIENALLLPNVFNEIARSLQFSQDEITAHQSALIESIAASAALDLEAASVRYAVRRLDAQLKSIAPSARNIEELRALYDGQIANLNVAAMAQSYKEKLSIFISNKDVVGILSLYDNKGLLGIAARQLGVRSKGDLVEFIGRLLAGSLGEPLLVALKASLPQIA